jgi:hypothetical protein
MLRERAGLVVRGEEVARPRVLLVDLVVDSREVEVERLRHGTVRPGLHLVRERREGLVPSAARADIVRRVDDDLPLKSGDLRERVVDGCGVRKPGRLTPPRAAATAACSSPPPSTAPSSSASAAPPEPSGRATWFGEQPLEPLHVATTHGLVGPAALWTGRIIAGPAGHRVGRAHVCKLRGPGRPVGAPQQLAETSVDLRQVGPIATHRPR